MVAIPAESDDKITQVDEANLSRRLELGRRLAGLVTQINNTCEVGDLCRGFPKRLQKLTASAVKGDRLPT